jgi:hypothetical protein
MPPSWVLAYRLKNVTEPWLRSILRPRGAMSTAFSFWRLINIRQIDPLSQSVLRRVHLDCDCVRNIALQKAFLFSREAEREDRESLLTVLLN